MTIAQGARSQLLYKIQSALGTAATGNYKKLKFNTHGLKADRASVESGAIVSDRMMHDMRLTTKSWSGDIMVELCDVDHEDLIASLMCNSWLTDAITIGTTPQYLTLEDGALDIAQYSKYVDGFVNTGKFSFVPNDIAKVTFGLVGTTPSQAQSSAGGTPTAFSTNQPFDSLNAALYENAPETGSEIAVITSLDFTVDNGAKVIYAIGQTSGVAIEYGRAKVTGSFTAYYTDNTYPDRQLNETEAAIVLNLTDPGSNSWEFRMERVKLTSADHGVAGEQSRLVTCAFTALAPTTGAATTLQITRN